MLLYIYIANVRRGHRPLAQMRVARKKFNRGSRDYSRGFDGDQTPSNICLLFATSHVYDLSLHLSPLRYGSKLRTMNTKLNYCKIYNVTEEWINYK